MRASKLFDIAKKISFPLKNGKNGFWYSTLYFKQLTMIPSRSGGTHPLFFDHFPGLPVIGSQVPMLVRMADGCHDNLVVRGYAHSKRNLLQRFDNVSSEATVDLGGQSSVQKIAFEGFQAQD